MHTLPLKEITHMRDKCIKLVEDCYRRRSCKSKTTKIHRFVRFVNNCFVTTVLLSMEWWYNSLYFGIEDGLMSRLQSVQNVAAHLMTGVRRCEHITPALRQLHWLPVHRRVDFKISILVYRSLAGTAPDECTLVTAAGHHPLWSADNRTCLVKRSRSQFGDGCFGTAGPTL